MISSELRQRLNAGVGSQTIHFTDDVAVLSEHSEKSWVGVPISQNPGL